LTIYFLTQYKTNTMIKMSYELKSISILHKYSSLLTFYLIFISFLLRLLLSLLLYLILLNLILSTDILHILLINTSNDCMTSHIAFAGHRRQYSWDRYIYFISSYYVLLIH
jgi:hypothetical protein